MSLKFGGKKGLTFTIVISRSVCGFQLKTNRSDIRKIIESVRITGRSSINCPEEEPKIHRPRSKVCVWVLIEHGAMRH